MGATDAKIISVANIPLDAEVADLCKSPGCEGYGQCANCPPHTMDVHTAAKWLNTFRRGLAIRLKLLPCQVTGSHYLSHFRRLFQIVTALERAAERQGFTHTAALGAGSCKPVLCPDEPCRVLAGDSCCYPHLARPSLEAIGINVFELCKTIGWPLNRILRDTDPDTISFASLIGLVLF